MATINDTTINQGIVLGDPGFESPLTITATGTISDSDGGFAIYGGTGTVLNYGLISESGGNLLDAGIYLTGPGSVTNSGTISSVGGYGVQQIYGVGGVSNSGTITGGRQGVQARDAFSITNTGTISGGSDAIGLLLGGYVTNSGVITGANGIGVSGGAGTVVNSGSISGTYGTGLRLGAGGSITNSATGVISSGGNYYTGVYISGGVGTVTNAGTIAAAGYTGVSLAAGGSVSNLGSAAQITGYVGGIHIAGAAGTVTNAGTITASGGVSSGVDLASGGSVSNEAGGLIQGVLAGVYIYGGVGTVTNAGTIASDYIGVSLDAGGSVANDAGGLIQGTYRGVYGCDTAITVTNAGTIAGTGPAGVGIYLLSGGTIINSGTISGGSGTAVYFGGIGTNRLVLEAGYDLVGGVVVGGSGDDTLELDGSAGAPLTVDYNALGLTNFENVLFGSGNYATLKVSNTSGTVGVTISGFDATTETIDLTGIGNGTITNTDTLNDRVTISGLGGTVTLQFDDIDNTIFTTAPDSGTGTDLSIACFCRGTLIETPGGKVAVEELAIGDRVITLSGAARPIKWIGRRAYAGRFVAGNRAVLPIRVAAGAIADGVPARDLLVSPEHALYIDGALVPAGLLVNGASIVQIEEIERVEYFHIEFAGHAVIFAEGAPTESFVDDDNRLMFHNAAEFHALYPDAPSRVPPSYCAPRVEEGFALDALRRRISGRARRLGADGTALPAVLRGNLERVHHARIEGWALDPASPDTPVVLVVLANGAQIGRVVADRYRRDLEDAGIGDGCHAFEFVAPGGLAAGVRHEIEVCRADDWSPVPGSPRLLEPVAAGLGGEEPHRSAAASVPLGALRGNLDDVDRTRIAGWAQDSADPERRVGLIVKVNDQVIGRVLANRYRGDLETVGLGDGHYAFELTIPGLSLLQASQIQVQREADGAELPGSPLTLPAANGFDAAIEQNLAGILANVAAGADEDQALAFLTQQTDRLLARRAARHGGRAEREAHRLFRRRWGGQVETGSEPLRAPQLRALVVALHVPSDTRDAGSVAILSHARALRALGYEVSFAASDDMGNAAALTRLAEAEEIATCGFPHYSCVEDVLCRQAGTFDLVYLHRAENADRYLPLVRRYCPKARLLYSVADLQHLRLARQAQVERRPELLARSRYLAAVEVLAARRADIVITHSPVEAELLRREIGLGKVHVVPFAVAPRQPRPPFGERRGVAILGSFGHAPNSDAVHYLTRDILPRVWARDPGLTCKIAGHGWRAGRLAGLDPRIEMIGEVEDLDDVFDTVRLTVAPLRFGAGIKGKVLDSFAAGLPCVMTPIAAEGLQLTGSLPQLVATDPDGLAELILHLHADQPANAQASIDGARLVAQQFSAERVIDALRGILQATPDNPVSNENPLSDRTLSTA